MIALALWLAACAPKSSDDGAPADDSGLTTEEAGDWDSDGSDGDEDCDDHDPNNFPGNTEVCDGQDNNCDDAVDEGVTTAVYSDADGDGYGDADVATDGCEGYDGWVTNADDCDDTNAEVSPVATETCNAVDDDCDGATDEDAPSWYRDGDGDGYGGTDTTAACDPPAGYVADAGDCDDANSFVNPAAQETCDGLDEDCDGTVDNGLMSTWYLDADADGYGLTDTTLEACSQPDGYASRDGDCDDDRALSYPGANEYCNNVDDDCDGVINDDPLDIPTWYVDSDGDGYGDDATATEACDKPSRDYVVVGGDCDDTNASVYPGAGC